MKIKKNQILQTTNRHKMKNKRIKPNKILKTTKRHKMKNKRTKPNKMNPNHKIKHLIKRSH